MDSAHNISTPLLESLRERQPYAKSFLWLDTRGNPVPIRYEYQRDVDQAGIKMFQRTVKFWAANSCMRFEKQTTHYCSGDLRYASPPHPIVVVVKGKGICEFPVGMGACDQFRTKVCTIYASHKGMINILGLWSTTKSLSARKHMQINYENAFADSIKDVEKMAEHIVHYIPPQRCLSQYDQLPTPFEFTTPTLPGSVPHAMLKGIEGRPLLVSFKNEFQYIIDYHKIAWLPPAFTDRYSVNTLYKCPIRWASHCSRNGKSIPKCKNYGYLGPNCKCQCGPGFSGTKCEKDNGGWFPPVKGIVHELQIASNENYDFASLKMKPMTDKSDNPVFKYYQFINIVINPTDAKSVPSVSLFLPFEKVRKLLSRQQDKFIKNIQLFDCAKGARLTWGHSEIGRMACECTSSIINNEKLEDARVFRGKKPTMSMYLINSLGLNFENADLSIRSSEFRLVTKFHRLELKDYVPTDDGGVINGTDNGTVNGTVKGGDDGFSSTNGTTENTPVGSNATVGTVGTAAAMTATSGNYALIGAIVAGLLLLLLCLLLICLLKRRKRHEEIAEESRLAETDSSDFMDDTSSSDEQHYK